MLEIPQIGKMYRVVNSDFIGKCVSYDLENDLEVILTNESTWESKAVKCTEIELIEDESVGDISNLQKN
jgi:hypothetical protein